jgi:hypothetical protein
MFIFRFRKNKEKASGSKEDKNKAKQGPPKTTGKRRIEQFKNVCKKITTFLFSRVGLCFVVIGYVVVGGFIFKSIEGSYEEEKAKNKTLINDVVNTRTENLVNEIWNMTKFELVFHEKNYTNKIKAKLIDYQKNLTDAFKEGYKGNSNHTIIKWTFPGSILYSVTIVTTIGYGHITCETDAGKIATIFYAIVGVPMMLLCLANIGTSMANLFRFLYAKVCCGYCNYVKRRHIRMKAATLTSAAASHANAISYAALTSTNLIVNPSMQTIIEQQKAGMMGDSLGEKEALDASHLTNIIPANKLNPIPLNSKESELALKLNPSESNKLVASAGMAKTPTGNEADLIELFDESNSVDYRKITVPISITLFILSSYILLGGILFKTLEEWTVLDGVYFCFITLSTIGLGDYVPGNSINDSDTQAELKLVGCSFYLLMGLSLIAMCFNLMQEEVSAKFRRLAVRLGIIDDPNFW